MRPALGYVLFGALLAFAGAHLALVGGLVKKGSWGKAALALVLPPLAPWWGWPLAMRRRTIAWLTALAVYALAVALA